ncbi:TetR/AcrR family transcriptional regulator [Kribbella sp. NPDC056861]|uniref:TetR/AcrR family transcriptional regulator n=1 Tax=Kribbella sp. NPDC056861 TaxID=3154857 RepID=UPI0034382701
MIHRPTSAEIDDAMLDAAAALFARRGVKDTAVQAVADEVGYSKAAVLQRFGSKAHLLERVIARCVSLAESVLASVADLPAGPARDARAIAVLTDVALANPGFVAMLIGAATNQRGTELADGMEAAGLTTLRAFGIDGWDASADGAVRAVRVAGCLGAVTVLSVVHEPYLSSDDARPQIIAAAYATLHGAGPPPGLDGPAATAYRSSATKGASSVG